MKAEVIFHGVPNGHDLYGNVSDADYIKQFYSNGQGTQYQVEVRLQEGKPFAYYHFVTYDNLVAADGRPGGYFGLTLCLDEFCTKPMALCQVLEAAFHSLVCGSLLRPVGQKLCYTVAKFSEAKETVEGVQNLVFNVLQSLVDEKAFVAITPNVLSKAGAVRVNKSDCTALLMLESLKKQKKVIVSTLEPSEAQKQGIKQLSEEQGRLNNILASKERDCKQLLADKSKAEDEYQKLQKEFNEFRKSHKISQAAADLKEPVSKLHEMLSGTQANAKKKAAAPAEEPKQKTPTISLNGIVSLATLALTVINFVAIVIVAVWLFTHSGSTQNNKKASKQQSKMEQINAPKQEADEANK